MYILLTILMLVIGIYVGIYVSHKRDMRAINDLTERLYETTERLNVMIRDESQFLETLWNRYTSLGDYLKSQQGNENLDWDGCDDVYE